MVLSTKLATLKSFKADISSNNPSSEQMETANALLHEVVRSTFTFPVL